MSDFRGLFNIRAYKEADKNFILSTFLRGLYYGYNDTPPSIWGHEIPKDIFMDNYKKAAQAMLSNPRITIAVACLPEDPDIILGYSILNTEGTILHWCFVKTVWRRKGIAKALVPNTVHTVTHLSSLGKTILSNNNNIQFNPFMV